jgi:hypothetical protein
MSTTERERKALEYPCPICHAQPHFRCLRTTRTSKRREHPHLHRMALAEENGEQT